MPGQTFPPFLPLVNDPHVLTILGNFWPRRLDYSRYPSERKLYRTEPDVEVLVETNRPPEPRAQMVMVHGLEGGADAGYMRTLAHRALSEGFVTHRFHMRTCGGTERHANTLYHGGLTSDLLYYLKMLPEGPPLFLAGFSLGGNVVLKLAGELAAEGPALLAGVAAISAPIDLAMAAKQIGVRQNRIYQQRFVTRMRARLLATGRYGREQLAGFGTLYDIDDAITAPSFGFGTADHYYATQSANTFLPKIEVPALLIAAQDDPLIPFAMYRDAVPERNPLVTALYPEHGGHLGFLARRKPRFWADSVILKWALARLDAGFTSI